MCESHWRRFYDNDWWRGDAPRAMYIFAVWRLQPLVCARLRARDAPKICAMRSPVFGVRITCVCACLCLPLCVYVTHALIHRGERAWPGQPYGGGAEGNIHSPRCVVCVVDTLYLIKDCTNPPSRRPQPHTRLHSFIIMYILAVTQFIFSLVATHARSASQMRTLSHTRICVEIEHK